MMILVLEVRFALYSELRLPVSDLPLRKIRALITIRKEMIIQRIIDRAVVNAADLFILS